MPDAAGFNSPSKSRSLSHLARSLPSLGSILLDSEVEITRLDEAILLLPHRFHWRAASGIVIVTNYRIIFDGKIISTKTDNGPSSSRRYKRLFPLLEEKTDGQVHERSDQITGSFDNQISRARQRVAERVRSLTFAAVDTATLNTTTHAAHDGNPNGEVKQSRDRTSFLHANHALQNSTEIRMRAVSECVHRRTTLDRENIRSRRHQAKMAGILNVSFLSDDFKTNNRLYDDSHNNDNGKNNYLMKQSDSDELNELAQRNVNVLTVDMLTEDENIRNLENETPTTCITNTNIFHESKLESFVDMNQNEPSEIDDQSDIDSVDEMDEEIVRRRLDRGQHALEERYDGNYTFI